VPYLTKQTVQFYTVTTASANIIILQWNACYVTVFGTQNSLMLEMKFLQVENIHTECDSIYSTTETALQDISVHSM
jgi:hypothetical protein